MTHSASKLQAAILALGLIGAESAEALEPREQRGFNFARTNCATCHEIGKIGTSPMVAAPPFRDLHTRYPVDELEESLAEGISTGHPSMPEWRLDPGEIGDFIAYLKTL